MINTPEIDAVVEEYTEILRVIDRFVAGSGVINGGPISAPGMFRLLSTPSHTAYLKILGCSNYKDTVLFRS